MNFKYIITALLTVFLLFSINDIAASNVDSTLIAIKDGTLAASDYAGEVKDSIITGINTAIEKADQSSNFATIYNDLKDGLKAIGSAIGTAASNVYKVFVLKHFIHGLSWAITTLFGFFCVYMFYRDMNFCHKDKDAFAKDEDNKYRNWFHFRAITGVIYAFGALFILLWGFSNMLDGMQHLINPHYYALQDILDYIERLVK